MHRLKTAGAYVLYVGQVLDENGAVLPVCIYLTRLLRPEARKTINCRF